eukprot:GHVO01044410.1.p1 GENE.GHVO01044410.1~~GHVO01044410.1.p1  ORF type:complete len:344 (-),score=50.37 GHVO01044410.1:229-1230(-)
MSPKSPKMGVPAPLLAMLAHGSLACRGTVDADHLTDTADNIADTYACESPMVTVGYDEQIQNLEFGVLSDLVDGMCTLSTKVKELVQSDYMHDIIDNRQLQTKIYHHVEQAQTTSNRVLERKGSYNIHYLNALFEETNCIITFMEGLVVGEKQNQDAEGIRIRASLQRSTALLRAEYMRNLIERTDNMLLVASEPGPGMIIDRVEWRGLRDNPQVKRVLDLASLKNQSYLINTLTDSADRRRFRTENLRLDQDYRECQTTLERWGVVKRSIDLNMRIFKAEAEISGDTNSAMVEMIGHGIQKIIRRTRFTIRVLDTIFGKYTVGGDNLIVSGG